MANSEHLSKLKEDVEAWNQWAKESLGDVSPLFTAHFWKPDLSEADLSGTSLIGANLLNADLSKANLSKANLSGAFLQCANLIGANLWNADLSNACLSGAFLRNTDLRKAKLNEADLHGSDLGEANLVEASLCRANLGDADLSHAILRWANLSEAILTSAGLTEAHLQRVNFHRANLRGANLVFASLSGANLSSADLRGADLSEADLRSADLSGADLAGVNLSGASLVRTNLESANLTDCRVYGVSVWDVRLEGAIQSNLVITRTAEPTIQVDNLEVAQFVYLLLNNERIRHVIDTITSKVVLILGRFTAERKAVLDAIREELRKRDYLPILFDFQKPDSKNLTGTVMTLANMARFIIADLTDPNSIPYELGRVVPNTKVPVQAIILDDRHEFPMFNDLLDYRWVLPPYRYQSEEALLASLSERVIAPAEAKVIELRQK